ncbi:MAG: hypothetical protein K9J27_08560 [Bacteroidales bacterium]|nr:hypothetical protein [Bacteroidales bacterium]MCF8333696.1 hypothetical protein [Bacteroidales bacterium]
MFEQLNASGQRLKNLTFEPEKANTTASQRIIDLIYNHHPENSFFAPEVVKNTFITFAGNLKHAHLLYYFGKYSPQPTHPGKKNLSILPANNPLAGFTDLIRALLFDQPVIFRYPSANKKILPALVDFMSTEIPEIHKSITFTGEMVPNPDTIFTYELAPENQLMHKYFQKYNGVIRQRKKSAALLSGREDELQLKNLVHGMMAYFGQSSHNISKLFIPENYSMKNLKENFGEYKDLFDHNTYRNNYDYYKSVFLLNKEVYDDNGFVLFKQDQDHTINPLSVIYFERYKSLSEAKERIKKQPFKKIYSSENGYPSKEDFLYPDLFELEENQRFLEAMSIVDKRS